MEIILYNPSGEEFLRVTPTENSFRERKVAGEHSLNLYFSLDYFVDISVGSWCEFQGQTYSLESPENFKKLSPENFEYSLVLHPPQARLKKYKLRNPIDRRLKFSYTATPFEHLEMLVKNLNDREPGWSIGEYIEETEKVISYNHTSVDEALNMIAQEFDTEWEIEDRTIHLRKVEHNKDNPLELSYGRGKGLLPNVGRQNKDNSNPIEVLFVQGGDKNIDFSTYGNQELLLPKSQILEYEGRTYISDEEGYSIRRLDPDFRTGNEDSLNCSHIYPKRVGNVTKLEIMNDENNFYDIYDHTIPEELDYGKYLIEGETMSIIFQSGMLAGKEFDVKYIHKDRRFEIVPQEIDGFMMPGGTYVPRAADDRYEGDRYSVFGCSLPDEYICENETSTGASWDMFRAAAKYLYENEEPHYSFVCEMDGLWSKNNWLEIGGKIIPGGYVALSDSQFQPEPILIRIVGIKEYIHKVHFPILELSNLTVGGNLYSELSKIDSNEVESYNQYKDSISFTKRRYRDSVESLQLLEEAFDNYNPGLSPLWIRTMSMLVGDESLQFKLTFKEDPESPIGGFKYDQTSKIFTVGSCTLKHMTLGIGSLARDHADDEYRVWDIRAYTSPVLDDPETPLYLYAICTKPENEEQTGYFLLSESAYPMEPEGDTQNYYFLVGALNSEYAKERSFITWYGFTEITPGRITVDRIVSGEDGYQHWDFENQSFRIGNKDTHLAYNTEGEKKLLLKGVMTQSPGGDISPIGVFRDDWDETLQYYEGDEVTHQGSVYRCMVEHTGIKPDDTYYWKVLAQRGNDGKDGIDGKDGAPPATHIWEAGKTYHRNDEVIDYVYYQTQEQQKKYQTGTWWKVKDGFTKAVAGSSPDVQFFEQITSFNTIATDTLLANDASLAGFSFRDGFLESKAKDSKGDPLLSINGEKGTINAKSGVFKGTLEGVTGSFYTLTNIDSTGKVGGQITFGSAGNISIAADLYHQGSDKYVFWGANIYARSSFGARCLTAMVVSGNSAKYYPYGLSGSTYDITLTSDKLNNTTYYKIPLYGSKDISAGCPVDFVILLTSKTYYYELVGDLGKKVSVFNGNDGINNNIYINDRILTLEGGATCEFFNAKGFMTPSPSSKYVGCGWVAGGYMNNDWHA